MRPNRIASFATLTAATLAALPAHAFSYLYPDADKPAAFAAKEVVFRLPAHVPAGLRAEQVRAAAERALAKWSEASGLVLRLEDGPAAPATGCKAADVGRNDIVFVDRDWQQRRGSVAETLVCVGQSSSKIFGADVLLNAADYRFGALKAEDKGSYEFDVEAVLLHEVGHALGMGHSESPDAVMYGEGERGDISKRELTEDDVVGVQSLYPAGGEQAQAVGCSSAPGGLGLSGLLGLVALVRRAAKAGRKQA